MPLSKNEHSICRKPKNQYKSTASFSKSKTHSISDKNNPIESKNTLTKNPKSKNKLLLAKLKVLGCKESSASLPVLAPAIIRSAAEWESKPTRNKTLQRRKKPSSTHNPTNHVADVPSVCCTPPGVGIASDFAPRTRNTDRRIDHKKHSQAGRRNVDDSGSKTPANGIGSRTHNHRSPRRIIHMMMVQHYLLSERIHHESDRYEDWRLNIDDMSYEELLDLSDRIGRVGTGLKEEEISNCLMKFKNLNSNSTLLLNSTAQKDWRCSICQDKCSEADDIGTLDCGHHHHLECIKQWLLQKNACPVCKSTAMAHKVMLPGKELGA